MQDTIEIGGQTFNSFLGIFLRILHWNLTRKTRIYTIINAMFYSSTYS